MTVVCVGFNDLSVDAAVELNKAVVAGMLQRVIQVIIQYIDFVCIHADPDVTDDTMEVNTTETGERVGQLYRFQSRKGLLGYT